MQFYPHEIAACWNCCPQRQWQDDNNFPCHIPSMACNRTQNGHSLSDGVLEPDPELCTWWGLQEGWPPVSSPPEALREWQVQLPERILGDQLSQGFGEEPIMRHWRRGSWWGRVLSHLKEAVDPRLWHQRDLNSRPDCHLPAMWSWKSTFTSLHL